MIYIYIYLIIGLIFAYVWWNKEYKETYDKMKAYDCVEDSMAIFLLTSLAVLWPIKLIKNHIEKR